jgi:hypothetical protein
LPGVPIIASSTASGAEVGSIVTDSQGVFEFSNLPVGTYILTPQLETGESSTPSNMTKVVTMGSTLHVGTFTVSNAFGRLSGSLTASGNAITTGVLIVAVKSPALLGANPPTNDNSLRTGTTTYYSGSSESDGTYDIPVRSGTYNVKAWYTTYNNGVPSVVPQSGSVTVAAGGSSTLDLSW